jgi:transcription antitermination factor NusB
MLNCEVVVAFGYNPAWSSLGNATNYARTWKERGTRFILFDPVYTDTASVLDAQWVPIRPGTDMAAMLAMAYVLLEEDEGGAGKARGKLKLFAEERVTGVLGSLVEIDAILVPLLENWDLYRLGTVERAVLRLGLWEITYSDVPAPVVINEAVDIVNWFSSPKSRTLVNGILDRYAKSR